MRVPTKPRYGLRSILDIAVHQREGEPVLLKDIAQRQGLSERYLEHVVASLRNAGLVKSVRGAKGGYYLALPPEQIKILDVFNATSGPLELVICVNQSESCVRAEQCASRIFWDRLYQVMRKVMEETTLRDLMEIQTELDKAQPSMYYI